MQAERTDENALLDVLRERLYVPVVSDVLDGMGLLHQAMDERLRPVAPEMRLIGRAHTVLTADVYERSSDPYRLEIASVDALKPNDVMVASTNHSTRTCFWGELLSTAAVNRGATGCLIDGHVRDVLRIIEMGFPVFATGIRPVDSSYRSQVIAYGVPVEVGGVRVEPGDVIFGDYDGVVVIPQGRLADVVEAAIAKVDGENHTRDMLRQGATLREVYDKYGVL
ncbi:MAG TPA: RraA family protein [Thermomicrobiales bacterium]|nr:RraA family protein [Thermomicrobiales bacterium]